MLNSHTNHCHPPAQMNRATFGVKNTSSQTCRMYIPFYIVLYIYFRFVYYLPLFNFNVVLSLICYLLLSILLTYFRALCLSLNVTFGWDHLLCTLTLTSSFIQSRGARQLAKVNEKYSGHVLRRGFLTEPASVLRLNCSLILLWIAHNRNQPTSKRIKTSVANSSPARPLGQPPTFPGPGPFESGPPMPPASVSPSNPRKRRASLQAAPLTTMAPPPPNSSGVEAESHATGLQPAPEPTSTGKKRGRTNTPWTAEEEHRLKTMRDAGSSWSEIAKVHIPFSSPFLSCVINLRVSMFRTTLGSPELILFLKLLDIPYSDRRQC